MISGKKILMFAVSAMIVISASAGNKSKEGNPVVDPNVSTVTGRITDSQNNTLPGATVVIKELGTGVVSDLNGYYKITNLKPGEYTINISYVGYEPLEKTIEVSGSSTVESDIVLSEMELEGVVFVGAFNAQRKAIQMQKENMGVSNIVSSDQVGKFPDSNIGDALKRINGINVQYDQGEARFGQVRGTSADLTSVTVNGNRLPSAEGGTRNVQLDLIPADMVQTIEVNKVVTSDMDGDAIGGAINLVTKNTPYERILNFTAGTGYSWISQKPQLNLGGTWGDRFFNKKLGVMISGSYQYTPGGSDNTEFEYDVDGDKNVVLKEAQVRQYYVTRERQSYSLALDYQINPLNRISFKGIYNRRNDWENRYRITYKKLDSKASKQSVVIQTKAGSDDEKNARLERQQTMDYTLDGEHTIGILTLDWALSYARATESRPNERYAALKLSDNTGWSSSFVNSGSLQPYSTRTIPSFSDETWKISELTNSNQDITENEYKARLNFTLPISKGDFASKLKFGAKYTRKDKELVKTMYSYDESVISDWKSHLVSNVRKGFMPGDQYPIGQQFISTEYLGSIDFSKYKGTESYEEEAGNFNATEQVSAGYIRLDQNFGKKLNAVLGVRVENTNLSTNGYYYEIDEDEKESLNPTGDFTHNYTNLLPSLLLKYKANDDWNFRASVTKTLSRPKYSAMIANKSYNLSDLTAKIGDPYIDPTTSWNYDLSTDYYFKSVGLVSFGLFYKDIKNVNVETIGYYTGDELGLTGNTDIFTTTQSINAYDAKIFGIEVAYQRDFSFICPALKCLGFYGNYTYTHSSTSNYNSRLGIKDGDNVTMAGSPEHSANASLNFDLKGWQARLSYNFASSFIDEMNTGDRALDRYYDSVHYLDFNASYTFGKDTKWTIYAEATNLLNQPLRYYQGTKDRTMQVEYYGPKVNIGFKVNL